MSALTCTACGTAVPWEGEKFAGLRYVVLSAGAINDALEALRHTRPSPTLPPSGGQGACGPLLERGRGPEGCMTYEGRCCSRPRRSTSLRWVGFKSDRTVRTKGILEPGGGG